MMQHRVLSFAIALVLGLTPALADTTSTGVDNTLQVAPANSQYVNPVTNANASTANISTQINNQNLGANSYGQGITCQAPQVALGGFGARQSSGVGTPNSDAGFTVQYLTPVGTQSTRSCQALANEVIHQRMLDTQLTFIQKCADFARAGIQLDPHIYPELARQCAGIRVSPVNTGSNSINAYPRSNGAYVPVKHQVAVIRPVSHISDFSPEHNSELQRIATHRVARVVELSMRKNGRLSSSQRTSLAQSLIHENDRLRAVIAEYQLENDFLHRIKSDSSWHNGTADLKSRVLSYNVTN